MFAIEWVTFGGMMTPAPGPTGSTRLPSVTSNTPERPTSACSRVCWGKGATPPGSKSPRENEPVAPTTVLTCTPGATSMDGTSRITRTATRSARTKWMLSCAISGRLKHTRTAQTAMRRMTHLTITVPRFSACRARTGRPAPGVGLTLEVGAVQIRLGQVLRVFDRGGHDQVGVSVRLGNAVEVFRHRRLCAVGDAVLPQVSRLEPGGDHLQ